MKRVNNFLTVLVAAVLSSLLVGVSSVYAGGGAAAGTDPTGGSCGSWWDTCYGYSWQKYKVERDFPDNTVSLHTTTNTGSRVFINGCKYGQYVYNYGLEVYHSGYLGYQVSTQRNKSGVQAPHAATARGSYPGSLSTIQNYTSVVGYVNAGSATEWQSDPNKDTAYNAFMAMKSYVVDHPDTPFTGNRNISWEDVGAFCFTPDALPEQRFYSKSNVALDGSHESTSITSSTEKASTSKFVVSGGSVSLSFSHNIFAAEKATNTHWVVKRTMSKDGGATESGFPGGRGYTIAFSGNPARSSDGVSVSNQDWTDIKTLSGNNTARYVADTRRFTDGSSYFVHRDEYPTVTFNKAGTYRFCETVYIEGTEYTSSCAEITVSAKTSYLTSSHASNRCTETASGGGYVTTGIQGSPRTVETPDIELTLGADGTAEACVTFSHGIYATQSVDSDVNYKVERKVTGGGSNGFNSSSPLYTTQVGNSPYTRENYGTPVTDKTKITTARSSDSSGANFIADTREYTDGTNWYPSRSFYNVTFQKKGTYIFCETIYLQVDGSYMEYTTACSKVTVKDNGTLPPAVCADWGTVNDTTFVVSGVQNPYAADTAWATSTSRIVYAKPNDNLNWKHCYFPGVQKKAFDIATVNNSHPEPSRLTGNVNWLNNGYISSWGTWTNCWAVAQRNMSGTQAMGRTCYSAGDYDGRSFENVYSVSTGYGSRVGMVLTESSSTGSPTWATVGSAQSHSWSCNAYDCNPYDCNCHSCNCTTSCDDDGNCTTSCDTCCSTCWRTCYETCEHGNSYYPSSRGGTASDTATVYVPYNFINTATIEINDMNFYAGETVSFNRISVITEPKRNNTTNGNYATRVDSARVRVVTYSSRYDDGSSEIAGYGSGTGADLCSALSGRYTYNNCDEVSTRTRTLNNPENVNGTTETGSFGNPTSYDAYDIPAGEYICFVVGVYPYTSGADTQMSASGDNSWYISRPSCHVIAKRPAFQVWGGGISAVGSIVTSAANKNMLHLGGTSTKVSGGIVSFGSWVEQNSNTTGLAKLLSTGAATGLSSSSAGSGSMESSSNFCRYRVPLSFANYSASTSAICSRSAGSLYVGYSGISPSSLTKDALVGYLLTDVNETGLGSIGDGGSVNLSDSSSYNVVRSLDGKDLRYTKGNGDLTIIASSIDNGVTHVVKAAGDVTINGNLQYVSASYGALSAIPKLIIYGENIIIGCSVGRIDAILIADKNVTTCNSDNTDSWDNAHALRINGAIVAGSLSLKRTYGATVGTGSGIPAEVINYDTSILLWEKGFAEGDSQSGFTSVYQKEVSPRY